MGLNIISAKMWEEKRWSKTNLAENRRSLSSNMTTSSPQQPVKIGIIGCGNISGIYFKAGKTFPILDIAACADLDLDRAKAKAEEHGVPKACTVQELLADPEIRIMVNLTIPNPHYN